MTLKEQLQQTSTKALDKAKADQLKLTQQQQKQARKAAVRETQKLIPTLPQLLLDAATKGKIELTIYPTPLKHEIPYYPHIFLNLIHDWALSQNLKTRYHTASDAISLTWRDDQ